MLMIVIGNLFSLLAMLADGIGASRKTVRGVLAMQTLGQGLFAVSAIALKGYSAAAQNFVSIVRLLFTLSEKRRQWLEAALIVLGVVLGLYFNNLAWVGLLPVIGNLEYAVVTLLCGKNERLLKLSFLIKCVLFSVFNAYIYNVVGVVSNIVVIVTTGMFLIRDGKKQNEAA